MRKLSKYLLFALSFFSISSLSAYAAKNKINVTLWSEGTEPKEIYPMGINTALGKFLKQNTMLNIKVVYLKNRHFGLKSNVLNNTDVLVWFGHKKHDDVPANLANAIADRVENHGMGFVALHSSHFSKPFKKILNTSGAWADYIDNGAQEKMSIVNPQHPIAHGVSDFIIPNTEMYLEPFDVPKPDDVIVQGSWKGKGSSKEVLTWHRGKGRIVYIRAGHEDYPIYYMPQMERLVMNSVLWAARAK